MLPEKKGRHMEKKSFEEFKKWTEENIKDHLPPKYGTAKVSFERITKHSGSYNGMFIRPDGDYASSIVNMDEFYCLYLNGEREDRLLEEMASILTMASPSEIQLRESILDYTKVRKNLFVRVCNKDMAGKTFDGFPTTDEGEFILTYNIRLKFGTNRYGSVIIDNAMLKTYGITKEKLHKDAVANSKKIFPACFDSCTEIITKVEQTIIEDVNKIPECIREMLIVSDKYSKAGSAVIFYPKILEEISRKLGGDFYLLPYAELNSIAFAPKYHDQLGEYLNFACNTYDPDHDGVFLSRNLYKFDSGSSELKVVDKVM